MEVVAMPSGLSEATRQTPQFSPTSRHWLSTRDVDAWFYDLWLTRYALATGKSMDAELLVGGARAAGELAGGRVAGS
jgi:hypothetical protein